MALASRISQSTALTVRPRAARAARVSRRSVVVRAETKLAKADRELPGLYAGVSNQNSLKYLDGTLPGDLGFDPLGLLDPVNSGGFIDPQWLAYSEVIHARWAMLGAAGCIAPEALAKLGAIPAATGVKWFEAGVIPPAGTYEGYWADPYTLFYVEVVAMQFAELRRLQDYRNPGSMANQYFLGLEKVFGGSGNPAYPGGQFFNLFNLGRTEAELKKLKAQELANGRLAMLAVFGYGAQAVLTRQGPLDNLIAHLSDPVANNILTNFNKVYGSS